MTPGIWKQPFEGTAINKEKIIKHDVNLLNQKLNFNSESLEIIKKVEQVKTVIQMVQEGASEGGEESSTSIIHIAIVTRN